MTKTPIYTITEMAEQTGLTLRALRFYEQRGILSPTREGLSRLYSEYDRLKLAKIIKWRAQGFTISEIKDALYNGGFPQSKIVAQLEQLRQQRDELDVAIAELMQLVQ